MIFGIFLVLLVIAASLIVFAYFSKNLALQVIGYFFLFLLGNQLLFGTLEYPVGQTVTEVSSTVSTITTDYQNREEHQFGFWLTFAAVVGFIGSYFDMKKVITRWEHP